MLFTSLLDSVPPELAFLKSGTTSTTPSKQSATAASRKNYTYGGWRIRQEGLTVELTHSFAGKLEVNGNRYDLPELGILCNKGKLDVRVDTRNAVTGLDTTPVTVFGINDKAWSKGAGKNIFPADSSQLTSGLARATGPVDFTFSFVELGSQTLQLDAAGLRALLEQLPPGCNR